MRRRKGSVKQARVYQGPFETTSQAITLAHAGVHSPATMAMEETEKTTTRKLVDSFTLRCSSCRGSGCMGRDKRER